MRNKDMKKSTRITNDLYKNEESGKLIEKYIQTNNKSITTKNFESKMKEIIETETIKDIEDFKYENPNPITPYHFS
jgi:hypothetical protein